MVKNQLVAVSLKGYTTEFVGKQALMIKGIILLVMAYAFYKLLTQETIQINIR